MSEEKKKDPVEKLGKDFRDFQKEWRKFLTNDFHHLVDDVATLIKQNDKQHAEIQQGVMLMQGNMESMNKTINMGIETTRRIVTILERKH
ncbi:hypothetical protein LCGC14_0406300 [marine sediment metagenome]|uniref:Uncharacterized protein n=1 Tax=marine sediment metagenome TaxID=412755 RepID=A0A0F9VHE0_9ZZZZ